MELAKILGKNINYYRNLNNLSQERLAEKLGISPKYLSRIECGKQCLSLSKIEKLAIIFKISPYKLLMDNQNTANR